MKEFSDATALHFHYGDDPANGMEIILHPVVEHWHETTTSVLPRKMTMELEMIMRKDGHIIKQAVFNVDSTEKDEILVESLINRLQLLQTGA